MDIFLLVLSLILVVVGIIGAIVPVLPSVSLTFLGVLMFKFSSCCTYSWTWVIIMGVLTLLVMGLNYYIPIYGAKKYGGSRYGSVGALVGFFLGMFFIPTPFGFLIGTIAGAFLGELIRNINNVDGALRSAWGSFVGFLLSTGLSLIVSSGMLALILFHNDCWF